MILQLIEQKFIVFLAVLALMAVAVVLFVVNFASGKCINLLFSIAAFGLATSIVSPIGFKFRKFLRGLIAGLAFLVLPIILYEGTNSQEEWIFVGFSLVGGFLSAILIDAPNLKLFRLMLFVLAGLFYGLFSFVAYITPGIVVLSLIPILTGIGLTFQPPIILDNVLREQTYSGWKIFANQNNLTFKISNIWLQNKGYVFGSDGGYHLRLDMLTKRPIIFQPSSRWKALFVSPSERTLLTRMALSRNKSVISSPHKKLADIQDFDMENVVNLLMPTSDQQRIEGWFCTNRQGRAIVYEQTGLETDPNHLQFILKLLKELVEGYPTVIEVGGAAVSGLLLLNKKYHHPLQLIAAQLLSDIGQDTTKRLKQRAPDLICPHCLIHYGSHRIITSGVGSVTFYGCKTCWQSREFIEGRNYELVIVLDRALMVERTHHNTTIQVNWLISRELFDFNKVEIIEANDEEVERFAVQVSNDTDPIRRRHYQHIGCTVWSDCKLSENTMRILKRTFGQIEIKAA